jgi:tetratricopeptide (TPR) repeat protein
MRKFLLFSLMVVCTLILSGISYGQGVPDRDYAIAVTLLNEDEFEAAESKFSLIIQKGDLSNPKAVPYIVNSYYGRASSRIEQGRKFRLDKKLKEATDKYNQAYDDLFTFKNKFEELQDTLKTNPSLYEEMEKHFTVISEQIVQLAGEAGDIAFTQSQYGDAVGWYDKGLQFITPQSDEYAKLIYAKADATFQLGRYQEALRLLSKFENELSQSSLTVKAMFYAGDVYKLMAESATSDVEKNNYLQKACDSYGRVVAAQESITDSASLELPKVALLERARCEKQLNQMEKALEDFKTLMANYPNTRYEVDSALEIGDYAFNAKQFTSAIENFERALSVAKSINKTDLTAIAQYWLGWSYFSDASKIDTESSPELTKRANALYEKSVYSFSDSNKNVDKFWKKEGKDTQMAKELDGYYGESIFMMGRGYQKLEKWDEAIRSFESISPVYQKWRLNGLAEIATSKEKKGDINGSLAQWDILKKELSLTRIPDIELDLLLRRADSLFDMQKYPDAEKAYSEIVSKYPNSANEPEARINLALSLFKQNRNKEALLEFNTLLTKYGNDKNNDQATSDALFWRGYLSARMGTGDQEIATNLRQAIADYRELIRRFPNNSRTDDAQYEIGFCTYSLGAYDQKQYTKAIDEYTKVLLNYPESEYADDSLYEIGRCYRLMGDKINEEKSLALMVQTYPKSELADNALIRVAELHYERAQQDNNREEKLLAENAYTDLITRYPGTESEAIAHFQLASIMYKFDKSYQRSADEFGRCVQVIDTLINKVTTGQATPSDMDVAIISNLLLRSNFWQGESLFQTAKQNQRQAQTPELVSRSFAQARDVYEQVLSRGTKLRSAFPEKTQNLLSISDGDKLEIPIISEAQFMISRCFYEEGNPNSAMTSLQQLKATGAGLKLKSDYLMALIAYDQKKTDEAKNIAESWLNNEIAKDMPDEYTVGMQNILTKIEFDSGKISEAKTRALDTWALYQSINGLWEESAYMVARCYMSQNDSDKARSWFNRLVNSNSEQWRSVGRAGIAQLTGTSGGK